LVFRLVSFDAAFVRAVVLALCLLFRVATGSAQPPPCTRVIHHPAVTHVVSYPAVTHIVSHPAVTHSVEHPAVFPTYHSAVTHTVHHDAVTHTEQVAAVTHTEYVQPVTHTESIPAATHTEYVEGYLDENGNWVDGYEVTIVDAEGYDVTVTDAEGYDITVVDAEGYEITVVDAAAYDEEVVDEPAYVEGSFQSGYVETVVDTPAWDETVVDQAAREETVVDVAAYDEIVPIEPDEGSWSAFDEVTATQPTGAWSPATNTVPAGQIFTQTSTVTRTHSTGQRNPCGGTRNESSYLETALESQQAMGMMLVTGGGSGGGGGGTTSGYTLTVIGGNGSGTGIAAGTTQQISAQGLAANDQYFTGWSVVSGPATFETSPISWSGRVVMGSGNVVIQANYAQATPGQPFWMDVNNDGIPDEIVPQGVAGFTVLFDDFRSEVDPEMSVAFNWQPFNNWFASIPGWFFAPGTAQERFITPEHFYFGFDFAPSFGATITTYCTANLDFPTQAGERYAILTRARNGGWWGSLGAVITSISGEPRYASDTSQDVTLIPRYFLARLSESGELGSEQLEDFRILSGTLGRIYVLVSGLPKGRLLVYQKNLSTSESTTVPAQVLDLLAFMRANSPTFSAAYEIRANENQGIALNPVPQTNGGTVRGPSIVFGTSTGVRPDGTAVYPAYTLAHEFGHENQRASNANPAWNLPNTAFGENEDGTLKPAQKIAKNSAEYYAYKFAEQVSIEIFQNTGINIGRQKDYWDVGTTLETRGLRPIP